MEEAGGVGSSSTPTPAEGLVVATPLSVEEEAEEDYDYDDGTVGVPAATGATLGGVRVQRPRSMLFGPGDGSLRDVVSNSGTRPPIAGRPLPLTMLLGVTPVIRPRSMGTPSYPNLPPQGPWTSVQNDDLCRRSLP